MIVNTLAIDGVLLTGEAEREAALDEAIGITHSGNEIAHALGNVVEQIGARTLKAFFNTGSHVIDDCFFE